MNKLSLLEVDKLIAHEKVDSSKVKLLVNDFKSKKVLKKPVVVDRETMVVLDGHHRVAAFKKLGVKYIPCLLVNYFDGRLDVFLRRSEFKQRLIKEAIISRALKGKLFPIKTTKHRIKNRFIINYKL